MLEKIKLPATFLVLVCLFMPLSTCSVKVPDPNTGEMHEHEQDYYAIPPNKDLGVLRYLPVLLFVWPLALTLQQLYDRKKRVIYDVAALFLSGLLLAYLGFYFYITRPALGGYLAMIGTLTYAGASLGSLVMMIRHRRKGKSDDT